VRPKGVGRRRPTPFGYSEPGRDPGQLLDRRSSPTDCQSRTGCTTVCRWTPEIPAEIRAYLAELDAFIDEEIKPLEQADDNVRFFDHRREWAGTPWYRGRSCQASLRYLRRQACNRKSERNIPDLENRQG
jgi:hypothetical protein